MAPVRIRNGRFLQNSMTVVKDRAIDLKSEVTRMATEALEGYDMFLVDVVVRGRQGSRVVEVFVDGDRGAGVDELSGASRQLAFLLESEDLIRGKYHLNVSSPGEDKALMLPRQYGQHVGRQLEVTLRIPDSDEPGAVETGELVASEETTIVLKSESGESKEISFDEIDEAKIVMPW